MDSEFDYPWTGEIFIYPYQLTVHEQLKCDVTLYMDSAKWISTAGG